MQLYIWLPFVATFVSLVSSNTYWRDEKYEASEAARAAREEVRRHATPYADANEQVPEQLFVHFIAHTHDDVGWLKTVDEYYSGANQGS